MAVINNYDPSLNYIARLRVVGSQNIPVANTLYYTIPVNGTARFSGVPEDYYEVGISIINAQGQESPIHWETVVDSTVPLLKYSTSSISGTGFTLSWLAAAGVSNYEYQIDHGPWISTNDISVALTGLTAGKVYTFRARAVIGLKRGNSYLSAVITTPVDANPIKYIERIENRFEGGAFLSGINRLVIGNALKAVAQSYILTQGFTIATAIVDGGSTYKTIAEALTVKLIKLNAFDAAAFSLIEFVDYAGSGSFSVPSLTFSLT